MPIPTVEQLRQEVDVCRFHVVVGHLANHPDAQLCYIVNDNLPEFARLICNGVSGPDEVVKAQGSGWLHCVLAAAETEPDAPTWVRGLEAYVQEQRQNLSRDVEVLFLAPAFVVKFR